MRFREAISATESAAARLELKDYTGELLEPCVALAMISNVFKERWEQVEDDLIAIKISPKEYAQKICAMIEEYRRGKMAEKFDAALLEVIEYEKSL